MSISYAVFCLKKKNSPFVSTRAGKGAPRPLFEIAPPFALPLTTTRFFFIAASPAELYSLSLHDALPISASVRCSKDNFPCPSRTELNFAPRGASSSNRRPLADRSEEHTSELQSHVNLVCRLLLEKKKLAVREHPSGEGGPEALVRDRPAVRPAAHDDSFFFYCCVARRALLSFPTRRSSDLGFGPMFKR